MINISEIKKYYPNLSGFDRGILREYLQYKILDIIFKSGIGPKLSFLGGTAIKICYGGTRFSEDLDFDNFGLTEDEFKRLSEIIKKELELESYEVEVRNVFKGAFRCYIKIPKLLKENNLSALEGEKILIQVDTAPHGFNYEPDNFLLQKFDVFRNIKLTPPDLLLSMKIGAIFGRKRMKGRDFYDTVYLLSLADFNYDYLEAKLGIKNKDELRRKLLEAITDLDMKVMARDVMPFLVRPDDQQRILSFRQYIEQKLK
ncbi:MAG: nucleotidyl transferase AbiEii/AbiGii toxin family protein [Patescibacteria group bacterium]|jgi:predicted nucleotidyltransferase component of viral defense system